MKASYAKALGILLLGFLSIFFLASVAFEDSQVAHLSTGSIPPPPSPGTERNAFNPQTLRAAGIFHPLTEEYLRQQAKEIPYDISESPQALERVKVFKPFSPLELALLPEEGPFLRRRKKIRKFLLGDKNWGDGWRPLSERERQKREKQLASKAVEMGAELADSLYLPYFSNSILWTTQRFNTYRHYLAEQYRLHFKFSEDDASVSYNVKY